MKPTTLSGMQPSYTENRVSAMFAAMVMQSVPRFQSLLCASPSSL
jgi:hypothetical protein